MEEKKKEFLTEENYEKGKKKILTIARCILIVGILLGGLLIVIGIVKTNQIKKQNEEAIKIIEQNNQTRTSSDIQADIDSIQSQIDELELQIKTLNNEKTKIFNEDKGFSDRYYAKDEEITKAQQDLSKLRTQLTNYESELWKVQSGFNNVQDQINKAANTISTKKYVPLYMFGGFIIIASCMASLFLYMFAKRREITAFTTQQVMPVAEEGIEKMAPTVGKAGATVTKEMAPAYGDIAKEISKGIKEGLKEEDK